MARRLSPEALANQILMRSELRRSKRVIVEGRTDRLLLERMLPHFAGDHRVEVAHGRPAALGVLAVLRRRRVSGAKVPVFVAFIDADFDCLIDEFSPDPDAIVTDAHDAEAMMMKSRAFEHALVDLVPATRHQCLHKLLEDGLRERLLEAGCSIGWFRLTCLERNLSLKFRSLDYGRLLDEDGNTLSDSALAAELLDHNRDVRIGSAHLVSLAEQTRSQYRRRAKEAGLSGIDPWELSCGHDLSAIAVEQVNTCLRGKLKLTQKMLEQGLREHYEYEDFRKTEAGRRLVEWAQDAEAKRVGRVAEKGSPAQKV